MPLPVTEEMVYGALAKVLDPELHHNIVDLGFVREVDIVDGSVHVDIQLTTPFCPFAEDIVMRIRAAVAGLDGVNEVIVERACQRDA